jgi:hypothetical protein
MIVVTLLWLSVVTLFMHQSHQQPYCSTH